jgi:hypothetical protein
MSSNHTSKVSHAELCRSCSLTFSLPGYCQQTSYIFHSLDVSNGSRSGSLYQTQPQDPTLSAWPSHQPQSQDPYAGAWLSHHNQPEYLQPGPGTSYSAQPSDPTFGAWSSQPQNPITSPGLLYQVQPQDPYAGAWSSHQVQHQDLQLHPGTSYSAQPHHHLQDTAAHVWSSHESQPQDPMLGAWSPHQAQPYDPHQNPAPGAWPTSHKAQSQDLPLNLGSSFAAQLNKSAFGAWSSEPQNPTTGLGSSHSALPYDPFQDSALSAGLSLQEAPPQDQTPRVGLSHSSESRFGLPGIWSADLFNVPTLAPSPSKYSTHI